MRRHSELIGRRAFVVLAVAAVLNDFATAQEPKGTFGFVAKVDADGLFNPTLKSVLIQSVQRDLPAALAGITAGDMVVEVDGTQVAGAKAQALADRMKKRPGESVMLRLARPDGQTYVVRLVAVAMKP
jgi:C-terminal processing protease CtpA/Prc